MSKKHKRTPAEKAARRQRRKDRLKKVGGVALAILKTLLPVKK